jgi:hypothetical protein
MSCAFAAATVSARLAFERAKQYGQARLQVLLIIKFMPVS